jgi:hypothetical protein
MRNRWEFAGTSSELAQKIVSNLVTFLSRFPKTILKGKSLFDCIDFYIWVANNFGSHSRFPTKNKLLRSVITKIEKDLMISPRPFVILELGVAYGDTLRLLQKLSKARFLYYGFDSFKGLPESWRGLPKGAFSNFGPSSISYDQNDIHTINFVVGWVEETLIDFPAPDRSALKFIMFDMDLFAPTRFAYKNLRGQINKGDYIYFDEAFDSDERLLIREYFLKDFMVEVVGFSPLGIVFKVIGESEQA